MGSTWLLVGVTERGTYHVAEYESESIARAALERHEAVRKFGTDQPLYIRLYVARVTTEHRQ